MLGVSNCLDSYYLENYLLPNLPPSPLNLSIHLFLTCTFFQTPLPSSSYWTLILLNLLLTDLSSPTQFPYDAPVANLFGRFTLLSQRSNFFFLIPQKNIPIPSLYLKLLLLSSDPATLYLLTHSSSSCWPIYFPVPRYIVIVPHLLTLQQAVGFSYYTHISGVSGNTTISLPSITRMLVHHQVLYNSKQFPASLPFIIEISHYLEIMIVIVRTSTFIWELTNLFSYLWKNLIRFKINLIN